ncbi:nucleotidyltransferase family protein [Anthocerotibacter panamensis]|uniref:nucleotidyltransferase family protein n=1 Tax=Anthocerotibacter panamensis TaxID=2857077 RepID=UPI001C4089AC|nr:NDP-sugar synthase [Anthocerotibacter panamensis]
MQAVIVAGGKGTRLRPLTHRTPKPMMPLFERPFLAFLIERCRQAGITDIILNVHYEARQIQDYFADGSDWGVRLRYSVEEVPLDTCGAVKLGEPYFSGAPLLIFNADILTDLDLGTLIDFHRHSGAIGTIALARVADPTAFGLVELDGAGRILSFREKPTAEQAQAWGIDTINAGTYVLEPEAFQHVPSAVPWSFERQLFPALVASAEGMAGFVSEGYWLDIGNPQKYWQAHLDVLKGLMPFDLSAQKIAPGVWVHPEATLDPAAQLTAPCYIGARCRLGAKAQIGSGAILAEDSLVDGVLPGGVYPPGTMILT